MCKIGTGLLLGLLLAAFSADAFAQQDPSRLQRRGAMIARLLLGSEAPLVRQAPRCAPSRGSIPGMISVIGILLGGSRSSEVCFPRRIPDRTSEARAPRRIPNVTSSFKVPEANVPAISSCFTAPGENSIRAGLQP